MLTFTHNQNTTTGLKCVFVPHEFHVNRVEVCWWLFAVLMDICDVLGQSQVIVSIWFVLNEPQQVKARQQRRGQLNVLLDRLARVIAAIRRVCSCQD